MDGIVFLVDAWDRERLPESKAELDSLMQDEQIADVPILVLGNKIDRPGAASEDEIRMYFGLYGKCTGAFVFALNIQSHSSGPHSALTHCKVFPVLIRPVNQLNLPVYDFI